MLALNTVRHTWDIPLSVEMDVSYIKKLFVEAALFGPMFFFAKSSILLLYYYLFNSKRWLRISVYTGLVLFFIVYWEEFAVTFVYCFPHSGRPWDINVLVSCKNMTKWSISLSAMNLVADLALLIMPLPIILRLQRPLRTRFGIVAMFSTAFL